MSHQTSPQVFVPNPSPFPEVDEHDDVTGLNTKSSPSLEFRIVKLEKHAVMILLSANHLKDSYETFRDDNNSSLEKIEELLQLIIMSSKQGTSEEKKGGSDNNNYIKAQCNSIGFYLTKKF